MSDFTNADGKCKEKSRNLLIEKMKDRFNPNAELKVFSLCANNLLFEQKVLKEFPRAKITCVEEDKIVFKQAIALRNSLGVQDQISIFNCHDHKYWGMSAEIFDVIWLDYCGCFKETVYDTLVRVLDYNVSANSLLAITLLNGREQPYWSHIFWEWSSEESAPMRKYEAIKLMISNETEKYELVTNTCFSYKDTSPMILGIYNIRKRSVCY